MIISASRRTDIPAFYSEWLLNRIREGYCAVPNPFNPEQVSRVSLKPEHVDVIVFWTRNPAPLLPRLKELDDRGFRYYFQYTLLNNPRTLDTKGPPLEAALETFKRLSTQIGPQRVIWRYDPIVFTPEMDADFHIESYRRIAETLKGTTQRSVISVMDFYPKTANRLKQVGQMGSPVIPASQAPEAEFRRLMESLAAIAWQNSMEIFSCAEELHLDNYGIQPGKCVDDAYIKKVFGIDVTPKKDPSQRAACGCVVSKDIGAYDTCRFGCQYCYATGSFERAHERQKNHNPSWNSIVGNFEMGLLEKKNPRRTSLRDSMESTIDAHDPYGPVLAELRLLCGSDDEAVFRESLRKLQPNVIELRKQYKKCPSRMDFSDPEARLAYLLTYYPHYIEQVYHVLANVPGMETALNLEHLTACFFGPGPAPEALGLTMYLRDHCPQASRLTGYLLDKFVDEWRLGQELTRYHLAPVYWPEGKLVFKPLSFDFMNTGCLREKAIFQAISGSHLLVMQNCLNDQMGNPKYAGVMALEILRHAEPGAIFLISDLDFDKIRELIARISQDISLQKLGEVILPVQEQPIELFSNFQVPAIIRECLLNGDENPLLLPKRSSKVYFAIFKRI
jgi:hypothetical protein